VHLLIAAGQIASINYLWACALTGRRDRALNAMAAPKENAHPMRH
jgi:hypothetical protein